MGRLSRCETVVGAIHAEFSQVHDQHQANLKNLCKSLLDGQIAFHAAALTQLQKARTAFDEPQLSASALTGPRLPSLLERDAMNPADAPPPLRQPSSWGGPPAATDSGILRYSGWEETVINAGRTIRSAAKAIQSQAGSLQQEADHDASMTRFAQFLSWQTNARGEARRHAG